MKKLHVISWTIYILGLIFKLLHSPESGLLLVLGCFLLFIHSIIFLLKNAKTNLPDSLINLTFSFWLFYLLIRFQFWAFGPVIFNLPLIFIIPLLISLTCFILYWVKHIKVGLPQVIFTALFLFSVFISYTPSDSIYYFFNLNTVLNSERRNSDYHSWDKYSWFLYLDGKKERAIGANQNAQKAVAENLINPQNNDAVHYSTLIKQHGQQILKNNWVSYP
jgi:hypothetical protein